jgi:hypothetical protein
MAKSYVASLSSSELKSILGTDPFVALVGSGVSIWHPTKLPAGQEFTSAAVKVLFGRAVLPDISKDQQTSLEELLEIVPFEALNERCPNQQKLRSLIARLYGGKCEPNSIHKALGDLVASNRISSIITTNYDLALDLALTDKGCALTTVFVDTQIQSVTDRAYFKVHGTIAAGNEDTLVYSLQLESAMSPWKRDLLEKLVRDRVLLIVGYSGFDFEVCPQLPKAKPTKIIWNFRTDEDLQKSPGYRRLVADGIRVESLIGDMRTVFELLGCTDSPTKISDATFGVESMLTATFSRREVILWCANVLNSMGHGRLSLHALKQLVPKQEADYEILRAYPESEHHRGKYRDAERSYMRAAKLAPDEVSRRIAILDASDEARCFGHWRRASRMIEVAVNNASASMGPSELVRLRARELLKRTLINGHWIQVATKFRLRKIATSKREEAAAWIREGSKLAIENGLWFDFQQFRLWADRMDMSANIVLSSGPFQPPASREGYTQLGYSLALLMVTRDQAKAEKRLGDVTLQTISELEKALRVAEELGSYPEMWKMTRLFIAVNPIRNLGRVFKLIRYFSLCQHAPTKRLPFLVLGA